MIEAIISLASYGYFGGSIGDVLQQWEQMGFFSYVLPFLLIFALVFGILNQIKLFQDNKAINGIVALAVGLMSLQFHFVPMFFAEIFPRLGVGLAILLVIMILAGMFVNPKKAGIMYTLLGIGAIIAVVVLVQTAGSVGWYSGFWWANNWPLVAGVVFILAVIGIIVGGTQNETKDYHGFWPFGGEAPKP